MAKYEDNMKLRDISEDPVLKKIILKYMPDVEKNPMISLVQGKTLDTIRDLLPDSKMVELFTKILEELKALQERNTQMTHFSYSLKTTVRPVSVAIAVLAIAISLAPAAVTQAAGTYGNDAQKWELGAGVTLAQRAYRDMDRDLTFLPLISYENKWIRASVPTLDLKLFSGESSSLRLRARYAGDGYEADDSPFLTGMDERKSSVWLGSAVTWRSNIANLSAELLGDASDHSNGSRARVQVDRRFMVGSFGVTPRLAAEWIDRKFVDYYYGVKASEVRVGRGFYKGDATTNVEAGLSVDYSPTHRYTVFLDLRATRFGGAIKESPLVDQASRTAVSVGYLYRF